MGSGIELVEEKRWINKPHPRLADAEDRRGAQLRRGQVVTVLVYRSLSSAVLQHLSLDNRTTSAYTQIRTSIGKIDTDRGYCYRSSTDVLF